MLCERQEAEMSLRLYRNICANDSDVGKQRAIAEELDRLILLHQSKMKKTESTSNVAWADYCL